MRILTDKLNSHIKKTAQKIETDIHWWGEPEKKKYHSKIDFIKENYKSELAKKNKKSKVIAIIRAIENTRTFANKNIRTKKDKTFTKMYALNKFVSHYYIYIDDLELGLCYLKIASYIPFVSEFYFNGHNYLKKQFDLAGKTYTMKDNSFTKIEDNIGWMYSSGLIRERNQHDQNC
jgi:molecular chaperone GrpE (heat shock protein)